MKIISCLRVVITTLTLTLCVRAVQADESPFGVVQDERGRFWFQADHGERFLSLGVNHIAGHIGAPDGTPFYDGLRHEFNGDAAAWSASVRDVLRGGGFNTVGAWSDPVLNGCGLYETVILYVAGYEHDRVLDGLRPGYEQRVRQRVADELVRWPNRQRILGYFLDNEASWHGRLPWVYEPTYTLLELALSMPAEDAARQSAISWLRDRYNEDERAFAATWGLRDEVPWDDLSDALLESCWTERSQADREAFIRFAAEAYFEPATRVVRDLAPGALVLGVRFATDAPDAVVEVCGRYCDVMSVNHYPHRPEVDKARLARHWLLGGKPILRTEFAWRGAENNSGNPNTRGAGAVVPTQQDRADNYRQYVEALLAEPMVIGAHWFEFADEPPRGRFDGEDSNYGIVDIKHRSYDVLLDAMAATSARVETIHAESEVALPTELPEQLEVTIFTGQYPDRPPRLDLLAGAPMAEPAAFHDTDGSSVVTRSGGALAITYDSGRGWGNGFIVYGPKRLAVDSGPALTTDLAGYTKLVVVATVPVGLRFQLLADEGSVGAPGSGFDHPRARDDGESYTSAPQRGTGRRQTYTFDLARLIPRSVWGNQQGKRCIDMNAMRGFGLIWPGGQDAGEMVIHAMRLER